MIKLSDLLPELEIPSGKWVDMDMSQIDKDGMKHIWKVYSDAYSAQSLDFSANNASELQSKYKAIKLIDVDEDKIPDAFIIYKPTKFGNKMALLAADVAKRDAKRAVVTKALQLVNTSGWFVEESAKMEDIMKEFNATIARDEKKIIDI